jgi:hypothetical protein
VGRTVSGLVHMHPIASGFLTTNSARMMVSSRFVRLQDKSRSFSEEEKKIGAVAEVSDVSSKEGQGQTAIRPPTTVKLSRNAIPPFVASQDLARGAFVVFQTAITYALMLSVMYVTLSLVSGAAKITQPQDIQCWVYHRHFGRIGDRRGAIWEAGIRIVHACRSLSSYS